jgi:hypothetical protein
MSAPEWIIVALAVIELLAVAGMGAAAYMMYRRVKVVSGWAQPAMREAKAIAARGKATGLETRDRAMAFYHSFRTLSQHVGRKVQTTTRLAREVVHPDLASLQEAAQALEGPRSLMRRVARLHEAGKIAAGQGNGRRSDGQSG